MRKDYACKKCDYFEEESKICQLKKSITGGKGHVNIIDKMFCTPYKSRDKEE
jgi:hypothetical protein